MGGRLSCTSIAAGSTDSSTHAPSSVEVGVESLEGKYASNQAAEQPHNVKEWLETNYIIVLSAMLWHTDICYDTIANINTGMRWTTAKMDTDMWCSDCRMKTLRK